MRDFHCRSAIREVGELRSVVRIGHDELHFRLAIFSLASRDFVSARVFVSFSSSNSKRLRGNLSVFRTLSRSKSNQIVSESQEGNLSKRRKFLLDFGAL